MLGKLNLKFKLVQINATNASKQVIFSEIIYSDCYVEQIHAGDLYLKL